MTHRVRSLLFSRNRKDSRERQLRKLANMRAAKARLRLKRGAAGLLERETKRERYYPLEFGVRDKRTGETAWLDLKSGRDVARRLRVLLKFYQPGLRSRP